MLRRNIRFFILVLFLFVSNFAFAQSAIPTFSSKQVVAHGKVKVLIIVAASSGEENKSLNDILSQSIRIEVENAGFKSELRTLHIDRVKDILADSTKLNSRLLKISQKASADFTVFCEYSLKKDSLTSGFYLFDTGKGSIINKKEADIKLDLSSDTVISSVIASLIKGSEQRIQEIALNKPVNKPANTESSVSEINKESGRQVSKGAGTENATGSKTGTNSVLETPTQSSSTKAEASAASEPEGRVIKGGSVTISLPKKYKHLNFGIGFAPFIPVGDLGDYLLIAYNPYAVFSYRFFVSFGILSPGFRMGSNIGYASGVARHGILTLSPIGIDISYATFRMAFLSLFLRATGGMAVITFFPEGGSISGTAVPYFEGGAGLNIFLTDSFKLTAEAAYSVYFNSEPLIMGLVPSLMLSFLL